MMAPQIPKIPTLLYCYLQRPNSLMHKKEISLKQMDSSVISCWKRINYALDWCEYSKIKKELYKMIRTTYVALMGDIVGLSINPYAKPVFRLFCQFLLRSVCQNDTPTDKLPQKRAAHESARFVEMFFIILCRLPWMCYKRIFKACKTRESAVYLA